MKVRDNFEGFTKKEIEGAIKAWEMQVMLGHPSRNNLENVVYVLIAKCPISKNNIINAYAIFGDNLTRLRGKTIRWKPERVEIDYVQIP